MKITIKHNGTELSVETTDRWNFELQRDLLIITVEQMIKLNEENK